jgi:predicted phage terminase large subunit-like protein
MSATLVNLYEQSFQAFATKAFNIVNPAQRLLLTPGFLAIAQKLAEVASGRVRRLVINVPPRSGKSLLASIALPAFVLGRDPTRRVICASYSIELAKKLSRDCRMVMQHPTYAQIFPDTILAGKKTETELETDQAGFRYATSVEGTLTGRGGNLIVIDDPMKPVDAMSATARENAWEWFTGTVGSRLDNKSQDAIVVVMQRLHVDDLAGRLLDTGHWDLLSIPAIAEEQETLQIGPRRNVVRQIGDILDPDREPREVLNQLREELGSANFLAQYQQQPVPEEGNVLKWSWFRSYDKLPYREEGEYIVTSWDTALGDRKGNDYSVAVVALKKPDRRLYILDVVRERLDFPSLRQRIMEIAHRHKGYTLIEATGSGISLLQDLRHQNWLIGITPLGEKIVRLHQVTPMIESGAVHLPKGAPWLEAFKRELLSFPASGHDDQVDALSQLLNWIRNFYQGPLQGTYRNR